MKPFNIIQIHDFRTKNNVDFGKDYVIDWNKAETERGYAARKLYQLNDLYEDGDESNKELDEIRARLHKNL